MQLALYLRQCPQSPGKTQQVPAVDGSGDDSRHDPFQIGHVPQGFFQLAPKHHVVHQILHSGVAAGDLHRVKQGLFQPGAQHPPAHGGVGLVEDPKQCALFLLGAHGLRQFQVPPGIQVQFHEFSGGVVLQLPDVGQVIFLQGQQGLQQRAAGDDGGGHSREAHLGKALAEVTFQQCFAGLQLEQLALAFIHAAV